MPYDTRLTARRAVARDMLGSNLPSLGPSRVGYFLSLATAITATIKDAKAIINVSASSTAIISSPPFYKGVATAHPAYHRAIHIISLQHTTENEKVEQYLVKKMLARSIFFTSFETLPSFVVSRLLVDATSSLFRSFF